MHTHFGSATTILNAFFGVLIVGTLWRLGFLTLAQSNNATLSHLAKAALFQY